MMARLIGSELFNVFTILLLKGDKNLAKNRFFLYFYLHNQHYCAFIFPKLLYSKLLLEIFNFYILGRSYWDFPTVNVLLEITNDPGKPKDNYYELFQNSY